MAPLDCNDFVTVWIPLEAVPARKDGGSPLVFASRSVVRVQGLTAVGKERLMYVCSLAFEVQRSLERSMRKCWVTVTSLACRVVSAGVQKKHKTTS